MVLLVAFVLTELRAPSPITPLRLFADRNRSRSYLARLLLVAGMMGMFFFLTQFLQDVLGYSALKTGFAFLPLTAVLFAASMLSARVLVERFQSRTLMTGGIALSTAGPALADAAVRDQHVRIAARAAAGVRASATASRSCR